jgi:hypothetical protein
MCAKRVAKENKWGDRSRFYNVKGKEYPSVTTILGCIGKPALIAWAAKVEREMIIEESANLYETLIDTPRMSKIGWITTLTSRLGKTKASQKELAKASEIGSQAHAWIEWQIKSQLLHEQGPCPVIDAPAMLAVSAWERWKDSVNFKPLLCEQPVWSETHEYAGTMDLLAEVNGRPTLLDWKTGKAIYQESFLQNAAYRHALLEMGVYGKADGMIVRLPKVETDPEFQVQPVTEPEPDLFKCFLSVLDLWKWLNKKEELVAVT